MVSADSHGHGNSNQDQPAVREARDRLVLRLLRGFRVCIYIYICMCVRTYHVRNNYVTYNCCHATLLQSTSAIDLDGCFPQLLGVVYHSYDFEMGTEKQRQRTRDGARLTESGNTRSEQLNTHGAHRVANQQSLACLSGSERRRPGWFLDMKYQTCSSHRNLSAIDQQTTRQQLLASSLPIALFETTIDGCRYLWFYSRTSRFCQETSQIITVFYLCPGKPRLKLFRKGGHT